MRGTLILGGARSGKSAYAESIARASGKAVVYVATAQAGDDEMAGRIAHHRQQRPAHWITIEEPLTLGDVLQKWASPQRVIVIDCLTLWLANLLFSEVKEFPDNGTITLPELFHKQRADLLQQLEQMQGEVVLVSNEVGMGIVPVGAISRCFTDEAGRLNQAVAARCERVALVVAGLPLYLKGSECLPG